MRIRRIAKVLAAAGLFGSAAMAAPAPLVQKEVTALLDFVAASGCEFQRNGSWHSSQGAKEHLQDKFDYLAARDAIHSAEEFIDKAASQSSLSGRAYKVRCNSAPLITSQKWLHDELLRLRKTP